MSVEGKEGNCGPRCFPIESVSNIDHRKFTLTTTLKSSDCKSISLPRYKLQIIPSKSETSLGLSQSSFFDNENANPNGDKTYSKRCWNSCNTESDETGTTLDQSKVLMDLADNSLKQFTRRIPTNFSHKRLSFPEPPSFSNNFAQYATKNRRPQSADYDNLRSAEKLKCQTYAERKRHSPANGFSGDNRRSCYFVFRSASPSECHCSLGSGPSTSSSDVDGGSTGRSVSTEITPVPSPPSSVSSELQSARWSPTIPRGQMTANIHGYTDGTTYYHYSSSSNSSLSSSTNTLRNIIVNDDGKQCPRSQDFSALYSLLKSGEVKIKYPRKNNMLCRKVIEASSQTEPESSCVDSQEDLSGLGDLPSCGEGDPSTIQVSY